jgi:hypothetical protein
MRSAFWVPVVAVALAAVATGCAPLVEPSEPAAPKAAPAEKPLASCPPVEGPVEMADTLMVDGQPVNEMLASPKARQRFLERIPVKTEAGDLRERVRTLLEDPAFEGIAGIYGREVLRALQDVVGRSDADAEVDASGQITHYGLNYDGSGCMRVKTRIERTSGGEKEVNRYKWHVRVARGGFTIVPKSDEEPDDPFPGTLDISDNDELLERIDQANFQYKLWAKGYAIQVHDVYYRGPTDDSFSRVAEDDPKRGHLYKSTPSSCIDMMFQAPPPSRLPPDAEPPFYCLGRCDQPRLINTM